MTIAVDPKLAEALARIAELEAEIVQGDAADRINNAHCDALDEAIEALEEEIVGERAKALDARAEADRLREELTETDQIRADAEREVEDLKKECEGLVEERDEAAKALEAGDGEAHENLAVAGDLLRDYLTSNLTLTGRLPRELQALADHLGVDW